MAIVIPPELAKTLEPRRPEQVGKPRRVTAKTAWERVRDDLKRFVRKDHSAAEVAFVLGQEKAAPELRARMQAAAELAKQDTAPETWTLEAASTFIAYSSRAIDAIEATMGTAFALEARLDSLRYGGRSEYSQQAGGYYQYLVPAAHGYMSDTSLRGRVPLDPSSDVRAACKEIARRAWSTATPGQKLTLAHVFFEEEAWVREVAHLFLEDELAPKRFPVEALYAIVGDPELLRAIVAKRSTSRSLLEIVVTLGDDAFDLVAGVFREPRDEHDLRHAATALSVFDDPRAAELLATGLGNAKVRPIIADYCARFPARGRAALEPIAGGKGRLAKLATELLRTIAKAEDAGAPPEATAAGQDAEEATAAELPWILVKPPWLDRKKIPRRQRPALRVEMLARDEQVNLPPAIARIAEELFDPSAATFDSEGEMGTPTKLIEDGGARLSDESIFRQWNDGRRFVERDSSQRHLDVVAYVFHRFGVRAIPGLIRFFDGAHKSYKGNRRFLSAIDSPRIAPCLARVLDDDRDSGAYWQETWGPHARHWMRMHPETAVIGLVPAALGGDDHADRALAWLRDEGVDVQELARPYGPEVGAALETLLGWDRRYDLPPRIAKLPQVFRPEAIQRPLLKNGKRLPLSAVDHIGTMLSFTSKRFAYPGIADVKAACDPRSLAEMAWDLARAWEMAGSKDATSWMLDALVHFADDEVVRRTTPAMRSQAVGEVLQIIGTDAAVMELVTIGARAASGNKGYSWASSVVTGRLDRTAAERGMTGEELEESVLPVREVDYKGFQLDYGDRVLEVRFDERLEPYIVGSKDVDGERLRTLPPKRKTDDAKKVEEAKRVWQDLREEVSAVVARRLLFLERAMVRGFEWTPADLRRRYVDHPLLRHVGRALVWEQAGRRFRIVEDGTFSDSKDEPFTLDPEAPVRLAHPARMPEAEVSAWSQLLSDYEIVQPLQQIGRATRALPEEQRKERSFTVTIPPGITADDVRGRMAERGWVNEGKRLSRGWARSRIEHTKGPGMTVHIKLVPPWLDYDPVDVAEALADFAF